MIIPFDKDFKNRARLHRFIDEFAQKPASWRQEFPVASRLPHSMKAAKKF
jgi:hypothetical protein